MKAICLKTFLDAETGDLREEGTRFDTTPERLAAINSTKYGQLAQEVPDKAPEAVPEAPRSKRTRRRTQKKE